MAATQRQRKIANLTLDPENARKHSEVDIDAIARSLEQFGQQTPIVITPEGTVIKGNGTLMAAHKLGWESIECRVTELTGDQLRAYAIADNQTGLLSEWDIEKLTEQIKAFEDEELRKSLGFDDFELVRLLDIESEDSELPEIGNTKEIDVDDYEFDHKCPRCQFEFNDE